MSRTTPCSFLRSRTVTESARGTRAVHPELSLPFLPAGVGRARGGGGGVRDVCGPGERYAMSALRTCVCFITSKASSTKNSSARSGRREPSTIVDRSSQSLVGLCVSPSYQSTSETADAGAIRRPGRAGPTSRGRGEGRRHDPMSPPSPGRLGRWAPPAACARDEKQSSDCVGYSAGDLLV